MNNNIDIKDAKDFQISFIDKIKSIVKSNTLKTFSVVTFGCQMNAKDSEKLVGILEECGFKNIENEDEADIVLFNTCTVRENANQKLYGHIGQLKNSYNSNRNKIIGICGCMMQEPDEVEKIQQKYPYIKLIFGTHNIYELPELLYNVLLNNEKVVRVYDKATDIVEELPIDRKYSFKCGINIMYGCNNFCSYCIVPYVRGRERSRNKTDIINEIKNCIKDGVIEVMLLGQNVNSYGNDKKDNINNDVCSFPELLNEVSKIDGLKRVRFMTSHPKDFSDELISVIKNNENICRHIHLPIQSGSNNILKQMNRKYTREQYLELVNKIKTNIKDVALTTDIIVGFPGETEEDFNDTLNLIKEVGYNAVFTFKYSKRTGTKAASLPNQVDEEVVSDRFNRLLDVVNDTSKNLLISDLNKEVSVLFEEINEEKNIITGRMSNNTLVHVQYDDLNYAKNDLYGKIFKVLLTKSHSFYYEGQLLI